MISPDTIHRLAHKYQTTELNINREYIQHLFLSYFYQQPTSQTIYFKGGTALRIAFTSPRFSEDLDFTTLLTHLHTIETTIVDTLKQIEREGITANIVESKPTTGGYLSHLSFLLANHQLSLEINLSQRHTQASGEIITVASDFLPPFIINILSQDQLIEEKLQALLARQKPRDFFDLYFILRKNLLQPQQKSILKQILPLLQQTHLNFEAELKQFLPKSHWPTLKNFKTALEAEILRT